MSIVDFIVIGVFTAGWYGIGYMVGVTKATKAFDDMIEGMKGLAAKMKQQDKDSF